MLYEAFINSIHNTDIFQEQYIFIHDAILESVICGDTEIPSANLRKALEEMDQIDPKENISALAKQFKVSSYTMLVVFDISLWFDTRSWSRYLLN